MPGGRPQRAKRQSYAELEKATYLEEEPEVPRRGRGKGGKARSQSGSAVNISDDVRAAAAGLRERKGAKKSYAEEEVDAYLEGQLMEEDTGYEVAGEEAGAPYEVSQVGAGHGARLSGFTMRVKRAVLVCCFGFPGI